MRPLFAAQELWEEAMDDNGLVQGGIVGPVISRAVKAHGLHETRPSKAIKVTDPKALLAEVERAQLRDTGCLEKRSEEHTSELQSLMRISYAVFCLTKNNKKTHMKLEQISDN